MYGRLSIPGRETHTHEGYRCFMYQVLGTVVYLAMSADATCRGLMSARDGPLIMEFTKDVFGWPEPVCSFPTWITRYTWRDLAGRTVFTTSSKGSVIYIHMRNSLTAAIHQNASLTQARRDTS